MNIHNEDTRSEQQVEVNWSAKRLAWVLDSGFRVIPIEKGAKAPPLLKDWPNESSSDPDVILAWYEKYPNCNWGIATGDGLYCVDIDRHPKDENGFETLAQLRVETPETLTVATPGQGEHRYFIDAEFRRASFKVGPGLEFKGSGSYCISPFSEVAAGVYIPVVDVPPARLPEAIQDIARTAATQKEADVASPVLSDEPLEIVAKAKLVRTLSKIDASLDRNDWRNAIYATLNVWGYCQDSVERLEEWSRRSDAKWNEREFWKVVQSFRPDHPTKLGIAYLHRLWVEWPAGGRLEVVVPDEAQEAVTAVSGRLLNVVCDMLARSGNEPSDRHRAALGEMARVIAQGLYTEDAFRLAVPLATGMGKTTACIACAKVIQDLTLDKSIAIFVEQVDQAAELLRGMERAGVDRSLIGLLHSSPAHREVSSIDQNEAGGFRFLIACHARAKSQTMLGKAERLLTFEGRPRDLVLWDESLLTGQGLSVSKQDVLDSIQAFLIVHGRLNAAGQRSVNHRNEEEELVGFLKTACDTLAGVDEGIVELPSFKGDIGTYRQLVRTVCSGPRSNVFDRSVVGQRLETLIDFASRGDIRIVKADNQGTALVQFERTIGPEFRKVVVLDASAPIRQLLTYDEEIRVHPVRVGKDYRNVELRVANVLGSKDSFAKDRDHFNNYCKEIAALLERIIPTQDEVLFFCHGEWEDDLRERVAKWQSERRGNLHVAHWGEHRATNQFAECRWVITVGVLYLDLQTVAAWIIGQVGNLAYALDDREVRHVHWSEQAENIYQAISRGNSRKTVKGMAGEQVVYLFLPKRDQEHVLPALQEVMPRIRTTVYEPTFLKRESKVRLQAESISSSIEDFVMMLSDEVSEIGVRDIATTLGQKTNSRPWKEAIKRAEAKLIGWSREKRKLKRRTTVK